MSDRKLGKPHRKDAEAAPALRKTPDVAGEESSVEERETPAFASPDASRANKTIVFESGAVVANRFRIVRFIARGGMGEVYEAEDQELRGRVALKTIRPDIAGNKVAMERFRREIQLARRVTHSNVCRVFDVFRHVDSNSGSGVTFLTMELLTGETLHTRLRRLGPMTCQEAQSVVEQMASALEAAHEAGVVHRDIKPQNVMLVDSEHGTRAVVTDFGMARNRLLTEEAESITGTGAIVGTPAYMAPEQLEGKSVTAAADVYALGLVMYEMVTGARPFSGESPFETAVRRLKEPPPSPVSHVPDLDPRWEDAILRCLELEPARRFESPSGIIGSLKAGKKKLRFVPVVAVLAALLVMMIAAIFVLKEQPTTSPGSGTEHTAIQSRRSIAVLGFKNLTGRTDAAWLSTALSEMLGTELAYGEQLRVIPGETVARMKVALSLVEVESYAGDTLQRIRSNLSTDFVVLGSYVAIGHGDNQRIRLDLRLQDTDTGETMAAVSDTGSEEDLFEIVARVGSDLRRSIGIEARTRGKAAVVRASLPNSLEATRLYSQGLVMLRSFDYRGARTSFEQAVRLEPDYPFSHLALAEVWTSLGYQSKAEEEVARAYELSDELSREERLSIGARYRAMRGEYDDAFEIFRALVSLFPNCVDYRLRLAYTLWDAGQSDEALETIDELKGVPGAREDAWVDVAESRIAGTVRDAKRQLDAARRAVRKARARGARFLLAEARLQQSQVFLSEVGQAEAIGAAEEAVEIYRNFGDRLGEAKALVFLADLGEDPEEAIELRGEAVALLQAIGANPGAVEAKWRGH